MQALPVSLSCAVLPGLPCALRIDPRTSLLLLWGPVGAAPALPPKGYVLCAHPTSVPGVPTWEPLNCSSACFAAAQLLFLYLLSSGLTQDALLASRPHRAPVLPEGGVLLPQPEPCNLMVQPLGPRCPDLSSQGPGASLGNGPVIILPGPSWSPITGWLSLSPGFRPNSPLFQAVLPDPFGCVRHPLCSCSP